MKRFFVSFLVLTATVACAPVQENGNQADMLEPFNRQVFAFNEALDTMILEPVAQGYRFVTPKAARKGVRNALRNLGEPVTMANALLQGDVNRFFTAGWRFILNSTFGVGGLYDFAGEYGNLPHRSEDFGQTLAVWGVPEGAYQELKSIKPKEAKVFFDKVASLQLYKMDIEKPGNLYYFMREVNESIDSRVTWGAGDYLPPKALVSTYRDLKDLSISKWKETCRKVSARKAITHTLIGLPILKT